jgi:hypothetical protein
MASPSGSMPMPVPCASSRPDHWTTSRTAKPCCGAISSRAADGVRDTTADQIGGLHVGGLHARHLRAVGPDRRGGTSGAREGIDVERRLPQAALHLQPRRYLSPHADERTVVALGEQRALARAGTGSDAVPRQPPRGHVRLDRLPSPDHAERRGHCREDRHRSPASGDRPA